MYNPYPGSTQMPETSPRPVPESVRNAVKVMYAGAATSIVGIAVDLATVNTTKSAIARKSPQLTATQLSSAQHVLVVAFIIGGLIGAAAWIFIARGCQRGQNWARITGTVLFAIGTVDTLAGMSQPIAGLVKIWAIVVWLVGLAAIVLLWRRSSAVFFKAVPA